MGQPKPLASLSSGLLARKGQAKPAMRPQGFAHFGSVADQIDDLGWNDMGQHEDVARTPPTVAVAPSFGVAQVPPVLVQREELLDEIVKVVAVEATRSEPAAAQQPIAEPSQPAPTSEAAVDDVAAEVEAEAAAPFAPLVMPVKRPSNRAKPPVDEAAPARSKAAFTLRLDADRHLRLRLASALRNQSSQVIVTAALDAYLAQLVDVEAMAAKLASQSAGDLGDGD